MLSLPATLMHEEAGACLSDWLTRLPPAPAPVEVDASGLAKFDSSALAALLALRRAAQARGQALVLRHMPERLSELSRLYGVDEWLIN